jgi:hypothetical protein
MILPFCRLWKFEMIGSGNFIVPFVWQPNAQLKIEYGYPPLK